MMAIHFITDSGSDILPHEARALGVQVLPLTVRFGDREYRDSVDLSHYAFYEKLVESDALPTTSQVPPSAFTDALETVLGEEDQAVIITLSSGLSGTYQSACIAAMDYPGRVFVVDSLSLAIGQRILVLRGLELLRKGYTAREIVALLEEEKQNVHVLAMLDTLEYLKKGGRISSAAAVAGTLLAIKPVVTLQDGRVAVVGKARGSKQVNNLLRQLVTDCGGIDFDRPLALAYSGLSDVLLQKYIADSRELWEGHEDALAIHTVGCTIGTYAGPGAVAVAFFKGLSQNNFL